MDSIGVGVIGLGMGAVHLEACRESAHALIRAVCDPDPEKLADVAARFEAPFAATDYRALIERADVDLVIVASPDFYHAEQAVAALEAGKHVLCEKPLALTVEECESIIAASDRAGGKFMVGQVCRFAPGFVKTKELVDAGAIGELFLVESEYAHNYAGVGGAGGWRKDPARPRHPVIGGGCHAVDLVRWIAGNVAEVSAYSNHRCLTDWPVDDCTVAALRFESGVVGRLMVSIGCKRDYTMRSTFYGTEGTIISDNTSSTLTLFTEHPERVPGLGGIQGYTQPVMIDVGPQTKPVAEEVEAFVDVVLRDAPVTMDAREGTRTVSTCVAIVESARVGEPVPVRNEF